MDPDPHPSDRLVRRVASRVGFVAAAFVVLACGWLAMRSDDWRRMVLFSSLAVAAAVLASAFSRAAR